MVKYRLLNRQITSIIKALINIINITYRALCYLSGIILQVMMILKIITSFALKLDEVCHLGTDNRLPVITGIIATIGA